MEGRGRTGTDIHTSGGIGRDRVFSAPEKWAADNVLEGLFLAWGPDFSPQGRLDGTRIIDLAPTILHLMGLPVPEDVDGRALTKLLSPGSEAAQRPVEFRAAEGQIAESTYAAGEEKEIADRLAALGYLE